MNTHKQSKLGRSIMLALAIAVVCIPVAQARNTALRSATADPSFTDSYIGHPGGPGSVDPVFALPSSGSYIGHAGGPGFVGQVPGEIAPAVEQGSSFDWGAAGIGAGFVVGLGLLAAGMRLMVRGRRLVAQPHV